MQRYAQVMFLLLDTQMMMLGKHKYSYNPEDYIIAAVSIFVDIINLFLFISILIIGWLPGRTK